MGLGCRRILEVSGLLLMLLGHRKCDATDTTIDKAWAFITSGSSSCLHIDDTRFWLLWIAHLSANLPALLTLQVLRPICLLYSSTAFSSFSAATSGSPFCSNVSAVVSRPRFGCYSPVRTGSARQISDDKVTSGDKVGR
jgi:hypothetical protein